MQYPTLEQVEAADQIQLGRWVRFLGSPGLSACAPGSAYRGSEFERVRQIEAKILDRIQQRFQSLGGWSPGISKAVGWDG